MEMENKINKYLNLVHSISFPIPQYEEKILVQSFKNLSKKTVTNLSNTGLDIVKHFHPSIWRCNIKGHLAPIDAWQDPYIMKKVILNRIKYLKTEELSIKNLVNGLSITKYAPKVSLFRPALAKNLIQRYLNNFDTIFDPCSGFSGRLLGTCALNKKYIGQDINSITVAEANHLINFLQLDAKVSYIDSIYNKGTFECLFTCPPYGDKENWHQDIEVLSADEWITTLLQNYKCKKYLFIVNDTVDYKEYVVDIIKNKSHFGQNEEKVILID